MAYDFSSLDFETLKSSLIAYIKDSGEFTDYDFDGSALNSIANLLTYTALQQNYYLNMTTQELYLDTATLYENVVVIAKSLNYIPHRKISSTIDITLSVNNPVLDLGAPIEIPQNCIFEVGGKTFITDTTYSITDNTPESIKLYQRTLVEETFSYNGEDLELLYGFDVDENLLSVTVNGVSWDLYETRINGTTESLIFFTDHRLNGKLAISFGNNSIGKRPDTGATINVTYGITEGILGNKLTGAALGQIIYSGTIGYSDSDVTITSGASSGGQNEESIDSIKVNAPKFYEAQNRAVNRSDYMSLLQTISFVDILNVWDGALESPPTYGTVFATFKPLDFNIDPLLTTEQKQTIIDFITPFMPMSIQLSILNPLYVYVNISSKVFYFKSFNKSTSAIRTDIETNLENYFTDELLLYDTKLKYSNLLAQIDDPQEVSNNLTNITLNVKFDKTVLSSGSYIFEINNELLPGTIINEYVKDDGLGNMIKVSDNAVIGSVNYATGLISFNYVNMNATDNMLYFKTAVNDVVFEKNNLPILGNITLIFEGV